MSRHFVKRRVALRVGTVGQADIERHRDIGLDRVAFEPPAADSPKAPRRVVNVTGIASGASTG